MRKLKKALSLTLALALSLAMAVPAFAEGNNWNLEVDGKADEEVLAGEKTFQLRNWAWSDRDENGVCVVTKETNVSEYTASQLINLKKGDTAVITNGGAAFDALRLYAWSDPDGDGVYDQRLMKVSLQDETDRLNESFEPVDLAGPLTSGDFFGDIPWYFSGGVIQCDGSIDSGEGVIGDVTELRLSADALLEVFGGNTLLYITSLEEDSIWTVLLEGGAAPEQPAAGTAYVVSAKQGLNVRTGPGANYPKARAALARNTAVQVVEVQGQWGRLANDAGWVFMPGLKAVSVPAKPAEPEQPAAVTTMVVKNSKGGLNVRTGPGTSYKLAGPSLKNGTVIEIAETQGQWGKLANDAGWVYLPGAKTVKG